MDDCGDVSVIELPVPYGTVVSVSEDGLTLRVGESEFAAEVAAPTAEFAYEFSGWMSDGALLPRVTTVADSMDVGYQISETLNVYTITVASSDEAAGTVSLGSIEAAYGTPVVVDGAVLTIGDYRSEAAATESTVYYAYSFAGWDVPSRTVSGDMAVTAQFEKALLSFVYEDVRYLLLDEGTVSAVGYDGEPAVLEVPDVVVHEDVRYVPVSIGEGAFADCATVTSVAVGGTVASIGEGAFDSPYLRAITVSEDNAIYSSEEGVLYDKGEAVLLKFPASKQRLIIPATVTEIAAGAFQNAGAALKADYDGGEITYFRYAGIPGTVAKIGDNAFSGSTLQILKLADGTKAVGAGAFAGCGDLSYVVFNGTLSDVGAGAFDGCAFHDESGAEMEFDAAAMAYHKFTGRNADLWMYVPEVGGTITYDGVKYKITDSETKTVYAIEIADEDATEIAIPAEFPYLGFDWTVSSVGPKAFMGNEALTSVTSAVDIGFKAFAKCSGLESVTLDGAAKIGGYAFFGCASLATADLGSATSVGESAFSGCASLADVDLSKVVSVGEHAFYHCALAEADLSSAKTIGYGAFTGNDLQRVAFSAGLKTVDAKAFHGCSFYEGGSRLPVDAASLAGKEFSGSDGRLSA